MCYFLNRFGLDMSGDEKNVVVGCAQSGVDGDVMGVLNGGNSGSSDEIGVLNDGNGVFGDGIFVVNDGGGVGYNVGNGVDCDVHDGNVVTCDIEDDVGNDAGNVENGSLGYKVLCGEIRCFLACKKFPERMKGKRGLKSNFRRLAKSYRLIDGILMFSHKAVRSGEEGM